MICGIDRWDFGRCIAWKGDAWYCGSTWFEYIWMSWSDFLNLVCQRSIFGFPSTFEFGEAQGVFPPTARRMWIPLTKWNAPHWSWPQRFTSNRRRPSSISRAFHEWVLLHRNCSWKMQIDFSDCCGWKNGLLVIEELLQFVSIYSICYVWWTEFVQWN